MLITRLNKVYTFWRQVIDDTRRNWRERRLEVRKLRRSRNATLPPCSGVWLWRPAACSIMSFSTITSARKPAVSLTVRATVHLLRANAHRISPFMSTTVCCCDGSMNGLSCCLVLPMGSSRSVSWKIPNAIANMGGLAEMSNECEILVPTANTSTARSMPIRPSKLVNIRISSRQRGSGMYQEQSKTSRAMFTCMNTRRVHRETRSSCTFP